MKMMKASKNFRNSKKDIYVHKSSLGDVECITQPADRFFFGRWTMTHARCERSWYGPGAPNGRWWCLSSRDWPQRQIQPKKNVRFLCVSYCFLRVFYVFPIVSYVFFMCFMYCISCVLYFQPVLGPFVQLPVPPPFTKVAIGYHKKWETYATAPRSTNYSSYFS